MQWVLCIIISDIMPQRLIDSPNILGKTLTKEKLANIPVASKCDWRSNSRLNLDDKDPRSRKTVFGERDD